MPLLPLRSHALTAESLRVPGGPLPPLADARGSFAQAANEAGDRPHGAPALAADGLEPHWLLAIDAATD